jgi:hypothetical protein
MPGFGESDVPPEPHTADVLADLIPDQWSSWWRARIYARA